MKPKYTIDRYTIEIKCQLDVLDRELANNEFIAGNDYTIADMAIWPWYGCLVLNRVYEAAEFLAFYNLKRTHQGYRLKGRTPAQALRDALDRKKLPPIVPKEPTPELAKAA